MRSDSWAVVEAGGTGHCAAHCDKLLSPHNADAVHHAEAWHTREPGQSALDAQRTHWTVPAATSSQEVEHQPMGLATLQGVAALGGGGVKVAAGGGGVAMTVGVGGGFATGGVSGFVAPGTPQPVGPVYPLGLIVTSAQFQKASG